MKYINDIETNVIKTNYILNSDSSPDKNNVVNGIWFDDKNRRVMVSRDLNSSKPHWCEVLTVCDIPKNENHEYTYNYNYNYNYYEYSYNYEYSYEYNYEYEYVYTECDCELVIETEDISVYSPIDPEQTFTYTIDVPVVSSETEGFTTKVNYAYTEIIAKPIEGSEADKNVTLSTEIQISETLSFTATEIEAKTEASFTQNATLTKEYSYTEYQKAPNKSEIELTIPEVVYNSPYNTTVDVLVEDSSYNVTTNISTTTNINTEVTIDVLKDIEINVKTELTDITGPVDIITERDVPETEILTNINTEIEIKIPEHTYRFTDGSAIANINNYTYTFTKLETETNVVIDESDQNLASYVTTEKTIETEKQPVTLYYSKPIYNNETLNVPTINDPDGLLTDQSANLVLDVGKASYKNAEDSKWTICNGSLSTKTSTPSILQNEAPTQIKEGDKFRLFFGVDSPITTGSSELPTELLEQNYLVKDSISNIFNSLTLTITKTRDSELVCSGGTEMLVYGTEYYTYAAGGDLGNLLPAGLEFDDIKQKSKKYTFYVLAFGEESSSYNCVGADGIPKGEIRTEYILTAPGLGHPFFCYASPGYNRFMEQYLGQGGSQTLEQYPLSNGALSDYYNMMDSGSFATGSSEMYVDMIAPKYSSSEISKIFCKVISQNSEFCSVAIVSTQEYEIVKDLPFNTVESAYERQIFVDTQQTENCSITGNVDKEIESIKIKGISIPNYKVTMNNFTTEISATSVPVEILEFDGTVTEFETEVSVNIPNYSVTIPAKTETIEITNYDATIKSYDADFTYNYTVDIPNYKSVEVIKEDYPVNIQDYPISITPDNPLIINDYPVNIPAGTIKESNVKVSTEVDYITEVDRTVELTYEGPVTVNETIEFKIDATVSTELYREIPVTLTEIVKTSNYNVTEEDKVVEIEAYDTRLKYYIENSETEIEFDSQSIEGLVGEPVFVETGARTIITNAYIDKNE